MATGNRALCRSGLAFTCCIFNLHWYLCTEVLVPHIIGRTEMQINVPCSASVHGQQLYYGTPALFIIAEARPWRDNLFPLSRLSLRLARSLSRHAPRVNRVSRVALQIKRELRQSTRPSA